MKPFGVISNMRSGRFGGRAQLIAFIPGIFLIALGVAAVLAPQVVAIVLAALLLYLGCIALFIGWKIVQLRRRLQQVMQSLSQNIQVVRFGNLPEDVVVETYSEESHPGTARPESRKIILH